MLIYVYICGNTKVCYIKTSPNVKFLLYLKKTGLASRNVNSTPKVEWYPIYGPKSLFKFGEKRPIVCCSTHKQKMNFEGFTQNGCYGNQSQPLEVLFDSTDANNPCPFTNKHIL